jgi:two-component system OmpR family response regulator
LTFDFGSLLTYSGGYETLSQSKILVVEDDPTLMEVLKYNLTKEGYAVISAADGLQGVEAARREKPDLIILDVMLPKMDGFEVCRVVRKEMIVPIIMLTARAEEIDKVVGLELGADDYMAKPFSTRELLARVHAMLRRSAMGGQQPAAAPAESNPIQVGEIEIDLGRHVASNNGTPLTLNHKEFDLLVFLVRNKEQVFNRETLLEKVWGYDYAGDTRTVDVHIRWLRQKLEADPEKPLHLMTVRGVGYKFEG